MSQILCPAIPHCYHMADIFLSYFNLCMYIEKGVLSASRKQHKPPRFTSLPHSVVRQSTEEKTKE